MKKLLSIVLAVVLCLSACSVAVFAAGEDIVAKATPSKTEVANGDTFEVSIDLTSNKGFNTLGIKVGYDADVLEVVCPDHYEGDPCYPVVNQLDKVNNVSNIAANSETHDVNPYGINWAYGTARKDVTNTGSVGVLTFKVKDSAKAGKTTITVTVSEATNVAKGTLTFAGVNADITVKCENHVAGEPVVTPAGCDTAGSKVISCKNCGAEMSKETIPATGHSYDNGVVTTPAECEKEGVKTYTCSVCGDTKTEAIAALEHAWDNGVVTTPAECEKEGVKTYTCGTCGDTKTEAIAALEHEWNEGVVTTEPGCETEGVLTYTCGLCGETDEETIEASGHTVEWEVTKEATLEETGVRTGTCYVCGDEITEDIPKLTNALEGDKVSKVVIDADGNVTEDAFEGFKVETTDDEPFTGYTTATVLEAFPSEEDDTTTVDGKDVVAAYMIAIEDTDTEETIDPEKVIKITLPVSEDILAAYENLVLIGTDENLEEVVIEGAEFVDGAFVVTAPYSELAILGIAGDKIVVEEEPEPEAPATDDDEPTADEEDAPATESPKTGESTAVAFAIVMLAIAAAGVVVARRKVRA